MKWEYQQRKGVSILNIENPKKIEICKHSVGIPKKVIQVLKLNLHF